MSLAFPGLSSEWFTAHDAGVLPVVLMATMLLALPGGRSYLRAPHIAGLKNQLRWSIRSMHSYHKLSAHNVDYPGCRPYAQALVGR